MNQFHVLILLCFLASCTINIGTDDGDEKEKAESTQLDISSDDNESGKQKLKKKVKAIFGTSTVAVSISKELSFKKPRGYKVLEEQELRAMHYKGLESARAVRSLVIPLKYAAKKDDGNVMLINVNYNPADDERAKLKAMNEVLRTAADIYEAKGIDIETNTANKTVNDIKFKTKTIKLFKGENREHFLTQELYLTFLGNNLVNIALSYTNDSDRKAQLRSLETLEVNEKDIEHILKHQK